MRLITKKENQALIIEGQEKKHEYLFSFWSDWKKISFTS